MRSSYRNEIGRNLQLYLLLEEMIEAMAMRKRERNPQGTAAGITRQDVSDILSLSSLVE